MALANYVWTSYADDQPTYGDSGTCQRERCPTSGRLHWQGCSHFKKQLTFKQAKEIFGDTHFEAMKGKYKQAQAYCSKSETRVSDPVSWGPVMDQGARNDLKAALECLVQRGRVACAEEHGACYTRYHTGLEHVASILREPFKSPIPDQLFPWQIRVMEEVAAKADTRTINWIYSVKGKLGKSTMARVLVDHHGAIELEGKMQDMSFMYNGEPCVIFDIPRCVSPEVCGHLFSFAEKLKNGYVVTGKYMGKRLRFNPPHIYFFANFAPPSGVWSDDRLKCICLDPPSYYALFSSSSQYSASEAQVCDSKGPSVS